MIHLLTKDNTEFSLNPNLIEHITHNQTETATLRAGQLRAACSASDVYRIFEVEHGFIFATTVPFADMGNYPIAINLRNVIAMEEGPEGTFIHFASDVQLVQESIESLLETSTAEHRDKFTNAMYGF